MPVDEQGSGSSQHITWHDSRSTEGDNSSRKLELECESVLLEIPIARPRLISWEPVLSLAYEKILVISTTTSYLDRLFFLGVSILAQMARLVLILKLGKTRIVFC